MLSESLSREIESFVGSQKGTSLIFGENGKDHGFRYHWAMYFYPLSPTVWNITNFLNDIHVDKNLIFEHLICEHLICEQFIWKNITRENLICKNIKYEIWYVI